MGSLAGGVMVGGEEEGGGGMESDGCKLWKISIQNRLHVVVMLMVMLMSCDVILMSCDVMLMSCDVMLTSC